MLHACAVVPETGRSQFMLVDDQQVMQLSLTEFDKMKRDTPISPDAAANAMVKKVGKRIAGVAKLPGASWEFILFEDPKTPNAFCLPGGKVGIYTGILPITQDEAGLATVMAHEVAHAVARHGAERISRGLLMQMGGQVLSAALQTQGAATQQLVMAAYGIGGKVGVALPHSRGQELEADEIGLLYMARAGYDPRSAVAFWKRFSAYNARHGERSPEFLSTHPVDDTRIAQLQQLLPKAMAAYQSSQGRN
jgi:predicted Zn-dependent protease